ASPPVSLRLRPSPGSRASGSPSGGPRGSGSSSFPWSWPPAWRSGVPDAASVSTPPSRAAIRPSRFGEARVRVSVIIPTFNEAASIGRVLADMPRTGVAEVLVVDRDAAGGTPEIAARAHARVVREPRRGYGRACLTGLAHVDGPHGVGFLDGDYSDRPAEMPRLLAPLRDGQADLVIGSR